MCQTWDIASEPLPPTQLLTGCLKRGRPQKHGVGIYYVDQSVQLLLTYG